MADLAVIALELQSSKLLSGVQQAESALKRLEDAGDRVAVGTRRTDQATNHTSVAMRKAAQEATAYAQATARLLRAQGDYSGAVQTLQTHLKSLSAASAEYVRVQAQIVQIQNQAGRALRGENFAGFAASLKSIDANLANLPGRFGQLASRITNASTALGELTSLSTGSIAAIGGVTAAAAVLAAGIGIAAVKIVEFGLEGAKTADKLTDLSQILGVSPGFLEKLGAAYTLAGKDVQSAERAITTFEGKLGEAASGNAPKLEKALALFGVNAKTASEDVEGSLTKVLDVLAKSTDQFGVAAVASELFGKGGLALVKIHKDLSDKTSELNTTLSKYHLLVGSDGLNAAGKLADAQDLLARKFLVTSEIIAGRLSPTLIKLIDQFLDLFVKAEPAINRVTDALGGILGGLGSIVKFITDHPILARVLAGLPGVAAEIAGFTASAFGGGSAGGPVPPKGDAVTPPRDASIQRILDTLNRKSGGGGATARSAATPKIADLSPALQGQLDRLAGSLGLSQKTRSELQHDFDQAEDKVANLRRQLDTLFAAGRADSKEFAQTIKQINELFRQQEARLAAIGKALPDVFKKVDFVLQGGGVPGAPGGIARGGIPGPGGTTGPQGTAPKPQGQFSQDFRRAGEQIQQEFLRGILSGREGLREAGAGLVDGFSFFFADYASKKLTEYTSKALDSAFDFIGSLIGGLFKKIFGGLGGGGAAGLFGGLLKVFGLAEGGYAMAGQPHIVGEHGPELFIPKQSGYVMPNSQIGGGGGTPVQHITYITMQVQTPDVSGFRKSQDQLLGEMQKKLDRVQQRNR